MKKRKACKEYVVDIVQALVAFLTSVMLILPLISYVGMKTQLNESYTPYPNQNTLIVEDLWYPYLLNWKVVPFPYFDFFLYMVPAILFSLLTVIELCIHILRQKYPYLPQMLLTKVYRDHQSFLRTIMVSLMWLYTLIIIFHYGFYIGNVVLQSFLFAITNPTAYLPFATTLATFLGVVQSRYSAYNTAYETAKANLYSHVHYRVVDQVMRVGTQIDDTKEKEAGIMKNNNASTSRVISNI